MEDKPHVLIFPFPAQGHIKAMLPLAELLSHAGLHVTFLNTDLYHHRLSRIQHLSARFPTLRFASVPDGLPADRFGEDLPDVGTWMKSLQSVVKPSFKDLLQSGSASRITCIIADSLLPFPIDVAQELGIPIMSYRTASLPCYVWANFCLERLAELGHVPIQDEKLNELVEGVEGLEGVARWKDLPSYFRQGGGFPEAGMQYFINVANSMKRASGLVLNTFDALDPDNLTPLAPLFKKIYTVGPLIAHKKTRIGEGPLSSSSSNLWQEDRTCIDWLDSKPIGSVIYVSFGSSGLLTHTQLLEFWHGLMNSGSHFLWVIRKGLIEETENGVSSIPVELKLGIRERGLIVDWAPQEEVLAHPSVGGFLTHSGWNSTIEAIVAGVPMLCWPQIADQQMNSRWVSEVWKIGIDMKDSCDRESIESNVRDLMENKREHFNTQMQRISSLAKQSVSPGGSSYINLDKLIEDIRNM